MLIRGHNKIESFLTSTQDKTVCIIQLKQRRFTDCNMTFVYLCLTAYM